LQTELLEVRSGTFPIIKPPFLSPNRSTWKCSKHPKGDSADGKEHSWL